MSNIISAFGIHKNEIEAAYDKCAAALDMFGLSDSDLMEQAFEILDEIGEWKDITNSCIAALFEATEGILCTDAGVENSRVEIYANGADSHIWIDGEEVFA